MGDIINVVWAGVFGLWAMGSILYTVDLFDTATEAVEVSCDH